MRLLTKLLPPLTRETLYLRLFGLSKVRMIWSVRPSVIAIDENRVEIKVPLTRFTMNHWYNMHIGTLMVGINVAGGDWLNKN